MKARKNDLELAASVGADSIPATFNHGRGVSPTAEDAHEEDGRLVAALMAYADELWSETPIRFSISDRLAPDGRGGQAERERFEAVRRRMADPNDSTSLDLCLYGIREIRNRASVFERVRASLNVAGLGGFANELDARRRRRNEDLDTIARILSARLDAEPSGDRAILATLDGLIGDAEDGNTGGYDLRKAIADATERAPRRGQVAQDVQPDGVTPSLSNGSGPCLYDWRDLEEAMSAFDAGILSDVDLIGRTFPKAVESILGRRRIGENRLDFITSALREVHEAEVKRTERNRIVGKENQANGNDEERERAAMDMKTALERVHWRMKKNGKSASVLQECRHVCAKFRPLTPKKKPNGEFEEYAPLTRAGGQKIKPETLAKNYRARYGTKKSRKAGAEKPERRTG